MTLVSTRGRRSVKWLLTGTTGKIFRVDCFTLGTFKWQTFYTVHIIWSPTEINPSEVIFKPYKFSPNFPSRFSQGRTDFLCGNLSLVGAWSQIQARGGLGAGEVDGYFLKLL